MIETTLTLRAVSGYWMPAKQRVCANTDLKIKLTETPLIRGIAMLFINGIAFIMENNECVIPASQLKEINQCILQDRDSDGNLINEWRLIETLYCEFEELGADGERQMLAEREVFKQTAENYAALQKAYEEEKAVKQKLVEEVIKQGQIIAEMQKDIEALKNEQI